MRKNRIGSVCFLIYSRTCTFQNDGMINGENTELCSTCFVCITCFTFVVHGVFSQMCFENNVCLTDVLRVHGVFSPMCLKSIVFFLVCLEYMCVLLNVFPDHNVSPMC